ncbi:uncharacterized protein TM35_000111040 [Trypanosoma theileri]|uniref:Uncharacterized protein n=1 Tax=Trypanosoma theileri TaxID=67003 RepID=A0A1X0NZJ6_9TRYP|nr:uncharacterized protein TM35_000111040 [Trypanosoma theileri]ORC89570.1 hypothetical protein TM35_000111040 [Trypanosoma theileri]
MPRSKSALTRDRKGNDDTGPSCENKVGVVTVSKRAFEQSRRHGGSASVVDPLLALLKTLHRLEESVYCVLESLGVGGEELRRYGYIYQESEESKAAACAPAEDLLIDTLDPVDRYIIAHKLQRHGSSSPNITSCGVTQEARVACVEAILRWIDGILPFGTVPDVASSREELVSRLTASGAETKKTREDIPSENSNATISQPRKKRERSVDSPEANEFSFYPHWKHYAEQLRTAYRTEVATVKAVCATDISKGLKLHAKWVESKKDKCAGITTPAAAALQKNYEQLIFAKDALADCQMGVTEIVSSLENAIDEYADQVRNVVEREDTFWRNVRLAEWESKALLELSRRIKKCC